MVYICHPYRSDPAGHRMAIRAICRHLTNVNQLPIAPQLYLPQFLDESTERDIAIRFCLLLLAFCDEVRVYGTPSEGMKLEIAEAERLGIPVHREESPP